MSKKRHKWMNDQGMEIHFPGAYRVEKCTICGLLKLHCLDGRVFHYLKYIKDGKEHKSLPECEDIKPLSIVFT